jgi:HK97 family phage prohead protease
VLLVHWGRAIVELHLSRQSCGPLFFDHNLELFMSDIERRFLGGEINLDTAKRPKIVGYAAVFNSPSRPFPMRKDQPHGSKFREIVRPGAFRESIANRSAVFALFQHDESAVLGSLQNGTLRLSEDTRGLRYEIDPPDTQAGRDVVELIRRGDVRGSSFGFKVRAGGQTLKRDGGQFIRELRSLELLDVSPVLVGAYPAAEVSLRSLSELLGGLDLVPLKSLQELRLELAEKSLSV